MSGMDGFSHQHSSPDADGLRRTINHLYQLAQIAAERGDQARADELHRVVKSYESQLVG